jgi:hypothetical protein
MMRIVLSHSYFVVRNTLEKGGRNKQGNRKATNFGASNGQKMDSDFFFLHKTSPSNAI